MTGRDLGWDQAWEPIPIKGMDIAIPIVINKRKECSLSDFDSENKRKIIT